MRHRDGMMRQEDRKRSPYKGSSIFSLPMACSPAVREAPSSHRSLRTSFPGRFTRWHVVHPARETPSLGGKHDFSFFSLPPSPVLIGLCALSWVKNKGPRSGWEITSYRWGTGHFLPHKHKQFTEHYYVSPGRIRTSGRKPRTRTLSAASR